MQLEWHEWAVADDLITKAAVPYGPRARMILP
jgi:hypothetical protein